MEITKSSRHSKIIGDFGEQLICNWLSRSGFEVVIVDHTGIDLIGYDPKSKLRIGITVKSRTRKNTTETEAVNIFTSNEDKIKFNNACIAFACEPWIGIYVETMDEGFMFLTGFSNYENKYINKGSKVLTWNMTDKYIEKYRNDSNVKYININFNGKDWNWK
jgi:hypothetical protein